MPVTNPAANVHNDFFVDLLETDKDRRGALALGLNRAENTALDDCCLTPLQTNRTDHKQKERRLDNVLWAKPKSNKSKQQQRLYLLEFKTDQSPRLFLQLLVYLILLLQQMLLPITVLVFYSGRQKTWNLPLTFLDYLQQKVGFVGGKLKKQHLNFGYVLVNLHEIGTRTLLRLAPTIGQALFIMCRIHSLTEKDIKTFFRMCLRLGETQRRKLVEKTCLYIMKCDSSYTWAKLARIERECLREEDCTVGRIQFTRKGIEAEAKAKWHAKGHAEGHAEGRHEIVLRLLKSNADLDDEVIRKAARLTKREMALLKQKANGKKS